MIKWFPVSLILLAVVSALTARWIVSRAGTSPAHAGPQPSAESAPGSGPAGSSESLGRQPAPVAREEPLASPTASTPSLEWTGIETTDYKQYIANLRAVGFPEELIRAIIVADVEKLYAPREEPLKPKRVAYDASLSERQDGRYSPADWERVFELRRVQMEKQALLKELLGVYVPRDFLRGPWSRNYAAYDYAVSLLPEEKRNAAQLIMEEEYITEAKNREMMRGSEETEAFRRSWEKRDADLKGILAPEEFNRLEMQTTSAGAQLARNTVGMEPTDEELAAMFKVTYQYWQETGGLYTRYRAYPVPPDQIAAAQERLQANLKEVLGPDRYLDYQMATTEMGQQMRNLGARYDLPREALVQAFQLQTQEEVLTRELTRAHSVGQAPDSAAQSRLDNIDQQTSRVLGPTAWAAWNDGKARKVMLDPEPAR